MVSRATLHSFQTPKDKLKRSVCTRTMEQSHSNITDLVNVVKGMHKAQQDQEKMNDESDPFGCKYEEMEKVDQHKSCLMRC